MTQINLRTDFFHRKKHFSTFLFYFNSKWLHKNLMIIQKNNFFSSFKQNINLQVEHSMLDRTSAFLWCYNKHTFFSFLSQAILFVLVTDKKLNWSFSFHYSHLIICHSHETNVEINLKNNTLRKFMFIEKYNLYPLLVFLTISTVNYLLQKEFHSILRCLSVTFYIFVLFLSTFNVTLND
jgi:hypothetical protein